MSNEQCCNTSRECRGTRLTPDQLPAFTSKLDPQWQLNENHHIQRTYTFDDFQGALDFTNQVGALAEKQNHHPDIYLSYGKVGVMIYTHKVDGLTEQDFKLAQEIEAAYQHAV